MVAHKIQIAPEVIAEGKRLYERTLTPLRDIAAIMGISRGTLESRIKEWGWQRRRTAALPIDLYHATRGVVLAAATSDSPPGHGAALAPDSPERRAAIAARIRDAVERAMSAVERTLDKLDPTDSTEAERSGRTLAAVSRTLRDLAMANRPPEAGPPDETDDDPVPGDIDEFRLELTRRIRGFIDARRHGGRRVPDDPDEPVD